MKVILLSCLITIVNAFIIYILSSFLFAEIDFRLWPLGARFMIVLIFCGIEVLFILGLATTCKEKKK